MTETLGYRLRAARDRAGMTRAELSRKSGVGYSTIAEIENEGISTSTKIPFLARALNVADEWLAIGKGQKERSNVAPGPDLKGRVPIISWVRAGEFVEAQDPYAPGYAEEWAQSTVAVQRHTFALRVEGDSMEPKFPAGIIIIVEPDMHADPGDFVIAKNGDAATFKQLVKDGGDFYLKPLNERYPIKPLGDSRIIGVVREAVWKFR